MKGKQGARRVNRQSRSSDLHLLQFISSTSAVYSLYLISALGVCALDILFPRRALHAPSGNNVATFRAGIAAPRRPGIDNFAITPA